jgi:uncharacterized protein
MIMRTLYIHGLDSSPKSEKIQILTDNKLVVSALLLDYRKEKQVYEKIRKAAIDMDSEFIIGSSLGGYLGYWLSQDLKIPCLLFNPAIHYEANFGWMIPQIEEKGCPIRLVALGANDDIVDSDRNWNYFNQLNDGAKQKVIKCNWLSHEIDLDTFAEIVNWATFVVRNFKK